MRLKDAAWLSGTNLLKNPMRTLLTILGLAVGVAAVLTVITLGAAGQAQVEKEIDKLGVDKVWITAAQGSGAYLSEKSAARIAEAADTPATGAAHTAGVVVFGDLAQAVSVNGYDAEMETVLAPVLQAGRLFTHREYVEGKAVAVVDEVLAEAMGEDVLGRRIALGSRYVTVVGIISTSVAQSVTGMVGLPLKTMMDTYSDASVSEVTVCVPGDRKAEAVAAMALEVLGDGFQAATLQEEIDAARSVISIFVLVLASVAAVCMVTGGIGVMNILLVSVRERRREIGLLKALGGTSRQVALLFLLEAVCYALLGGIFGLVLGSGMIGVFGRIIGLSTALSAGIAAGTLLGAGALGALFGVAPALKASGMLPVDALRQE